ncbi:MAG: hypothetical protein LUH63_12285 [Parabacteroides sp.]|nr:hypothetical protein [Parabacteroides sp.]
MAKKKIIDDRKQLLIRYRIDENGCVSFIDPCCDDIPALLFCKVMEAISNVEQEWNTRKKNKLSI